MIKPRNTVWGKVTFILALFAVTVVVVAIVPLMPAWLAPQLLTIIVVRYAVDGDMSTASAWAIWGGLVFDFLSPARFGLIWLPYLVVIVALSFLRRASALNDTSWLWPVWFGGGTAIVSLPLTVSNHAWGMFGQTMVTTTVWGVASLVFIHWMQATRPRRSR